MRKSLWIFTSLLMVVMSVGLVGAWGTNTQVPCDFVTGGGFIVGTGGSSLSFGAHGNFGVGGGVKNGAFWGHLEYNDHGSSPVRTVHGTSVISYIFIDDRTRYMQGTCSVNGVDGYNYEVKVTDNGEPGRKNDEFSINVFNGSSVVYTAGAWAGDGPIQGGNIQLHKGNASNTPPEGFTCR